MGRLERGFWENKIDLVKKLGLTEPRTEKERYEQEGFLKRIYQNKKPSESAENYVRSLIGLRDERVNGHGFDAIDHSFSPSIKYEVKSSTENVLIPNTQFHYDDNLRRYLIAVKREDKLSTYEFVKRNGKKRKIIKNITPEDLLLFNFGDIFILPYEVIREHYIAQRTKHLIKENENYVGKDKRYKNFKNLVTGMRVEAVDELEKIINKQKNGESINHEDRIYISLTFAQASQIITKYGDHYTLLMKSKKFNRDYKFRVIPGPYKDLDSKIESNIFLMDYDDVVINEIVKGLTEKINGKTRIELINKIKIGRIELYNEIQERKKDWNLEEDKNLEERLIALSKWQDYEENLFS
ncbi:MAG: hypothetical protein AABX45_02370 [Nanoarchaeota archaeon]